MSQSADEAIRPLVIIADTSWLIRDGFAYLVSELHPPRIVQPASDLPDLHRKLRGSRGDTTILISQELVANREDVVFDRIRDISPNVAIGIIGNSFTRESVLKTLYYGALSVICTDESRDVVAAALGKFFSGKVALPRCFSAEDAPPKAALDTDVLTRREGDVFALLGEGRSVPLIAESLQMSPHTVRVHIAHIMKKLDLHDRSALMHYAVSRLMVRSSEPAPVKDPEI